VLKATVHAPSRQPIQLPKIRTASDAPQTGAASLLYRIGGEGLLQRHVVEGPGRGVSSSEEFDVGTTDHSFPQRYTRNCWRASFLSMRGPRWSGPSMGIRCRTLLGTAKRRPGLLLPAEWCQQRTIIETDCSSMIGNAGKARGAPITTSVYHRGGARCRREASRVEDCPHEKRVMVRLMS
jgi:hypothetical protein